MKTTNARCAKLFINAIKTIAAKPDNLENLETYLSYHFNEWLKLFAANPESITAEMKAFAEMDI